MIKIEQLKNNDREKENEKTFQQIQNCRLLSAR